MKETHQTDSSARCDSHGEERKRASRGEPPGGQFTRRDIIRSIPVGMALSSLPVASYVARAAPDYWTVVALPDTQFYAERDDWTQYAHDQTEWVADNSESEHIRFVTHEGDIVENGGRDVEWERMDSVMSTLDGEVPYSAIPGNHDWEKEGDRTSSIENFTETFGASRYENRSWFGGTGPETTPLNFYQYFSGGAYDFLHLALELEPPGEVDDPTTSLGWARRVLDDHQFMPTILTTHYYLEDDGRSTNLHERNGIGNTGEEVWQKLVKTSPQVFMVLCGHIHGENHQISTNDAGLSVYEVLADYQDYDNGGNGWMRLIRFQPGGESGPDRIQFVTYSPSLDEYMTDSSSEFSFDLQFDERFNPASWVGDVDGNGELDQDDVTHLQKHLSGRDIDTDEDAADVNGDGRVDIADAVTLNNYLEGS
ncbi:dockerin type I domain-containing protein (plasmid) [Haloferax sp. S1W]|uniref:dockerin type I domain-containing protein n=1 Tax=Haloferax sp. S1W TaxID=3377110 RepID=UPI0037C7FAAA